MPKISIITTAYKHEKFIAQTIDSILNQSFSDWELLIGDDSPDNATWQIIEQYTKKYPDKIRAWHHSPNKGIVDNMNFLIKHIAPETHYVSFLEGDDMYTPDNLEKKMSVFEKFPNIACVYSDLSFINSQNEVILESFFRKRGVKIIQNEQLSPDEYLRFQAGPIASYSTGMIRRDILKTVSITSLILDDKTYSVSDYDFYFQVATNFSIYWIEESLTLYRRHSGNLSAQNIKLFSDLDYLIDSYYRKANIYSTTYYQKKSFICLLLSVAYLDRDKKIFSYKLWKDSWDFSVWNFLFYKTAILFLLLSPSNLRKKILNRQIIR